MNSITPLLQKFSANEPDASRELLSRVYDELRMLAASGLRREAPGQTLQATALVHEAWLRLMKSGPEANTWENRRHFFGAAAQAIRRILVESARRKKGRRHGGQSHREDLNEAELVAHEPREDILALNEALERLAQTDRDAAELVQLRYFAGMTIDESAELLGISSRSAVRLWAYARAWLHHELCGE